MCKWTIILWDLNHSNHLKVSIYCYWIGYRIFRKFSFEKIFKQFRRMIAIIIIYKTRSRLNKRDICIKDYLYWEVERWYPWCNGYRRRKWTRRNEFKSWTRQIAFHIALISLGKVWIQLFSFQLWVNSRADWVLQLWCGNQSRKKWRCP